MSLLFIIIVYIFYSLKGEKRNLNEQLEIIQNNTQQHLGYANVPITDIPYEVFAIDILHKFLRVSDLLVDLLLDELLRQDQFYAQTKFNRNTQKHSDHVRFSS